MYMCNYMLSPSCIILGCNIKVCATESGVTFERHSSLYSDIEWRKGLMVLLGRIELPASPLPRECSTTELQQHRRVGLFTISLTTCFQVLFSGADMWASASVLGLLSFL